MADKNNTAIYLHADGKLSVRSIKEQYHPTDAQSLIRVTYSAVNPADIRHAYMGMAEYVAGYEFVGSVVSTGPESSFKKDQKVFGIGVLGDKRPLSYGAHQDFLIAEPQWTWPLNGIDELKAVSFPIAALTSIDALFNQMKVAFPPADVSGDDPTGIPILIWGGASALGQAAIQLAAAAGFSPIITTASPRNHDLLKSLGATYCFDYNSDSVEDDIRGAVANSGKSLTTVYDTIGAGLGFADGLSEEELAEVRTRFHLSSPAMAKRCCTSAKPLKLCCSLIVEKDSDWTFPIPYRLSSGQPEPPSDSFEPVRAWITEADRTWGDRLDAISRWCLQDGNWTSMPMKTVRGPDAAIDAIKEVFAGRSRGRKFVIEHPLSQV